MFWTAMAGAFCGFLLLGLWWLSRESEVLRDALGGFFGIITTPFFLEGTVFVCGLSLVVLINHWRQKRDGDGWVFLAEEDPPQATATTPTQPSGRHDAIFTKEPEPLPDGLVFDELDGLLELGTLDEAGELLVSLSHEERESPRGLEARLRLAEALGQSDHATTLRARLEQEQRG